MKKLTIINPVIFVIVFLATLWVIQVDNIKAQAEINCNHGRHDPDENIITGRVTKANPLDASDTINVNHGIVKLLRINPPSAEVVAVDSANINAFGFYSIYGIPPGMYYIVAYPNDEDEDYIISFYPSGQLWNTAVKINLTGPPGQVRMCNVQTINNYQTLGGTPVLGEIADSLNHNIKLKNSIITAKSGNEYRGFAMTDNQGKYIVNSILPGNYNLTATRFGYRTQTQNVNISTSTATVNFYMGRDSSYTIGVSNSSTVIKDFKLNQNYPNPFNPSTEITFTLDKAMKIKLSVYSIEGKFIKELVNGYRQAGEYKVSFNGENLSSGVYNYVMETGTGQRESKLMVFTK